jgi:hypothetical protein
MRRAIMIDHLTLSYTVTHYLEHDKRHPSMGYALLHSPSGVRRSFDVVSSLSISTVLATNLAA